MTCKYARANYSCLPDQLAALGRAYGGSTLDDHAALKTGVTQFEVDFTQLRAWHDSEPWLQANSIVVVAAGDDGLSGFQHDGSWGGYRKEITRFSEMIFSGRPGERDFWVGDGRATDLDVVKRLGGSKPCIHGSDAHALSELFRPDRDRYCWIKADPTYEGLKQLLYEPADRVHIGPTPPILHDRARGITSVALSSSNGWFDDVEMPLNAGLVSIIGRKGSGKSALAELIAYAAGSWPASESDTFLKRAGQHLQELQVRLKWADDEVSQVPLGQDQSDQQDVRFLSQKFVERLCSDDHLGTELVSEIETVVFSYLDPTDTLNASSFDELRALRTEGIRSEGRRLRHEMRQLIGEECRLRENASKLAEKNQRLHALSEERAGLLKQMPQPATDQEAKVQSGMTSKRQALAEAQRTVADDKEKLQRIRDIRTRIGAYKSEMERFAAELRAMLDYVGVPADDRDAFALGFAEDTNPPLDRREAALNAAVSKREGSTDDPPDGTIL